MIDAGEGFDLLAELALSPCVATHAIQHFNDYRLRDQFFIQCEVNGGEAAAPQFSDDPVPVGQNLPDVDGVLRTMLRIGVGGCADNAS